MNIKANFNEAQQSQLPFAEMLLNMGYRYISRDEIKKQRREDNGKFILQDIAEEFLMKINSYEINDKEYKFTQAEILRAIDELEKITLEQDGLIESSKKKYKMLMSKTASLSIAVSDSGKSKSQDFVFIDFDNVENNDFAFTVEFEVAGKNNIRADVVIFVNGIPFVVVENKKSSVDVEGAISQLQKYQSMEYAPKLFVYPQLLIATNKSDFLYGTTGTPKKFYTKWREKVLREVAGYVNDDAEIKNIIAQKIDEGIYLQILKDLNGAKFSHRQILDRKVSDQDRGVYFLLAKERLLDMEANFILFDGSVKIAMRYQQFFGVKKILDRIQQVEEKPTGERRLGGIVWHTQGSGKSLTMVNLVKELIEDERIENPRIIVVTDRIDLDKQIKGTFDNAGLKKDIYRVKSGEDLVSKIKSKDARVLTTLVQKFKTASNKAVDFQDLDKNIFVLIDEAHRTHGGEASTQMTKIIPNACYIAFTGTPLLKEDKTEKKFGGFIDKYTIDDALEDKIILPLFYEARYTELEQNEEKVNRHTERILKGATDEERKLVQKKIQTKVLKDNPQRIAEISYDIEKHFSNKFKGTGLKAQLVAPSQFSAVLFQKYFEEESGIKTAVILSGVDPDESNAHKVLVTEYMDKLKTDYGSLKKYEDRMIADFVNNNGTKGDVEILIVVDKLLTGFDAPRNTVLYLAKEIREHNLLQAIARVNRLFDNENKEMPKTAGFIIDYSENAKNLREAMDLFGNFKNRKDVESALFSLRDKIDDLESSYENVQDFFKGVENKEDDEEYIELFKDDKKKRKDFYNKVNLFVKNFAEASVFRDFVHEFKHYDVYRQDLKKILNLKKTISLRYSDRVDYSKYKNAITAILDKYVDASEVQQMMTEIDITEMTQEIERTLKSDKAKAEAIAAKMQKTITEKRDSDPEFYNRFSEKVRSIIVEMNAKKMADLEALKLLKGLDKEMKDRKDYSLPMKIQKNEGSGIFYRNLKEFFVENNISEDEYTEVILGIFKILDKEMIVDWQNNIDAKRKMQSRVDDYLYENVGIEDIKISKKIQNKIMELLLSNLEQFKK